MRAFSDLSAEVWSKPPPIFDREPEEILAGEIERLRELIQAQGEAQRQTAREMAEMMGQAIAALQSTTGELASAIEALSQRIGKQE